LAHRAGINRNYVGLLERAANSPTLDTIERLAAELAVDPVRFFEKPGGRWTQQRSISPIHSVNFTFSQLHQADHCLWRSFVPAAQVQRCTMQRITLCQIRNKFALLPCSPSRGADAILILLKGGTYVGSW